MTRKSAHTSSLKASSSVLGKGERRRSIPALVDAAIVEGGLADLSRDGDVDACAVVEAALPAIALGDLGQDDSDWVDRHLATCPECESALAQTQELDSLLGTLSIQLPERQSIRSPWLASPAARDHRADDVNRATLWSMDSPLGGLYVAVSSRGVCEVDFAATIDEARILSRLRSRGFLPEVVATGRRDHESLKIGQRIADYLSGIRRSLDLPYDLGSATPFTRLVLGAAATIPFGSVSTYGAIAVRIGQPGASRAIGNALGRNPVPLFVPCHRVVRSDLTPGGFVGGTAIKQQLLRLEGATFNPSLLSTS